MTFRLRASEHRDSLSRREEKEHLIRLLRFDLEWFFDSNLFESNVFQIVVFYLHLRVAYDADGED